MTSSENSKYNFDKYTQKPLVKMYTQPEKEIPVIKSTDVLVVGGSQTGVCAAIAAARHGAKVCLVERFGFLGGQSIYSLVVQWEKRAYINNLGAVLTKGIPQEILNRVIAKGGSDGLWETPPGCVEMRGGEEWLNPEAIKLTLIEMCEEEGIELLFHTLAVDVIMDRDKNINKPKITGVIFENKTGRFAVEAKKIIDATADLDIVWKAIGEEGCGIRPPEERMTSAYYTWYAGIQNEEFINWYVNNPNARGIFPDPKNPEKVLKHFKENKEIKIGAAVFTEVLEQAEEQNLLEPIERLLEEANIFGMVTLQMKWVGNDRWCLEPINFSNVNMLDTWMVSKFEIIRQKIAFYMLPILRLIPGWKDCYISRESLHLGTRESRWLKAIRMIDQDYIWNTKHETEPTPIDTVGRSGAHDPGKNLVKAGYPIPYSILIPEKVDGVIVCARSVGTHPDRALDAHRGITPSMVTGQAAGTAAALTLKDDVEFRNLDVSLLHNTLRSDGVQLDHESYSFDFEIPKEKIKHRPK